MKRFKWLLLLVLAVCLCFGAVACGNNDEGKKDPPDEPNPPVPVTITVTGVEDGKAYPYGTEVIPVFDKGTATLKRDSETEVDFASGTKVTKVGSYVLTVTYQTANKVVNFSIALPDTTGQITDEFIDDKPAGTYFSSDSQFEISNGDFTLTHPADTQAWGIAVRKIEHFNATEWPYIEVNVKSVKNCNATLALHLEEYGNAVLTGNFDVTGIYYLDVKACAEKNGWNMTDQTLFLKLNVVGNADTEMTAVFDYYRSAKELKGLEPCGAYVDNTPETINQWIPKAANIQWFEGDDSATAVVTSPKQGYGQFAKRVNLNTKEFPYLIVDVAEVVTGWKIDATQYVNYQKKGNPVTIGNANKAGKVEINLQKFYGESENVDVLLEFYIEGKSEDKTFRLKGLETVKEPIFDVVMGGTKTGETVNNAEGTAAVTFDKGKATVKKNGGEAAAYVSGTELSEVGTYEITVTAGKFTHTVTFEIVHIEVIEFSGIAEGDLFNLYTDDKAALTFTVGAATLQKGEGAPAPYTSGTEIAEVGVYTLVLSGEGYKTETIHFTVVNRAVWGEPFEDYLSAEGFNANGGKAEFDSATGIFTYTGNGNKLQKRYTLTFPNAGGWLVFDFKSLNDYKPDRALGFEVLDDNAWYALNYRYTDHKYVAIDEDGVYHVWFKIGDAKATGNENTTDWHGMTKENLNIGIYVEANADKRPLELYSFRIENQLPEGVVDPDTPVGPSDPVEGQFEDFTSKEGFTLAGDGSFDVADGLFVLKKNGNDANVKLTKAMTLDFTKGGYLALTYKARNFTPDAGFGIELLDDGAIWYQLSWNYPDNAKVVVNEDGTSTVYFKLKPANNLGGGDPADWSNETAKTLKVSIQISYGGEKIVELHSLAFAKELPKDKPVVVEAFTSKEGFTLAGDGSFDVADGLFVLKKNGNDANVKLTKTMTLDFTKGGYIALTYKARNFTPDAGFGIELLDDGAIWYQLSWNYTDKAKEVKNDDGTTTVYFKLKPANNLGGGDPADWSNETAKMLKVSIQISYGGEKIVELHSLGLVKELPAEATV